MDLCSDCYPPEFLCQLQRTTMPLCFLALSGHHSRYYRVGSTLNSTHWIAFSSTLWPPLHSGREEIAKCGWCVLRVVTIDAFQRLPFSFNAFTTHLQKARDLLDIFRQNLITKHTSLNDRISRSAETIRQIFALIKSPLVTDKFVISNVISNAL